MTHEISDSFIFDLSLTLRAYRVNAVPLKISHNNIEYTSNVDNVSTRIRKEYKELINTQIKHY